MQDAAARELSMVIGSESLIVALAVIDSADAIDRATEFERRVPGDLRRGRRSTIWIHVAEVLGRKEFERFDWILENVFNQWVIGKEDLG